MGKHPGVEIAVMHGDKQLLRGESDWMFNELRARGHEVGEWHVMLFDALTGVRFLIKPVLLDDKPEDMLTAVAPDDAAGLEAP